MFKNLLLKKLNINKYIKDNNLNTSFSKKKFFEKYQNELITYSKLEKKESYTTKKGKNRVPIE